MLKKSLLKLNIDSVLNKYLIDEVTFLPNHKYSFIYNDRYYIGFFKRILEKDDKQIYVFSNFSIELNINETSYMFDFHHHKLSPNIAKLLDHNTFSDSDSDGFESDISPNYKNILEGQIRDDFDDYIKIDLCDIGE
jgi:hypothetical protein